MLDDENFQRLSEIARRIRFDVVKMTYHAGSGHPGGSMSIAEILTILYFKHLRHRPSEPHWADRDRVVLSKGHACPALYAVLAEAGYYPREEMWTLRKFGSRLQGHPAYDKGLPGIEVSTGSLGQGLSIAVGMALAFKHLDHSEKRVYAIVGDGEIEEGQIWEAFMSAGHYHLDNLVAIIDNNDLQIDGFVPDVMNVHPIVDKVKSFNWHPIVAEGHDLNSLDDAFERAKQVKGMPVAIIAKTVKGKGISYMENVAGWHGKAPNRELAIKAVEELGFPADALDNDIE
ncbi:transketolase [bacterium]|nr:MAG: transketolase [bacterium]